MPLTSGCASVTYSFKPPDAGQPGPRPAESAGSRRPSWAWAPKGSVQFGEARLQRQHGRPSLPDSQPAWVVVSSARKSHQHPRHREGKWEARPRRHRRRAGETAQTQPFLPALLYLSQPQTRCGRPLSRSFRSSGPHRVVSDLKLGTVGMTPQAFTPHNPSDADGQIYHSMLHLDFLKTKQNKTNNPQSFKPGES